LTRTALQKAREAPSSTKARILAAAEEVFATKGFAGASTREIAAAAGVNISSLHYHWESKETLYVAVFQNIYDRILELVRTSIPDDGPARAGGRSVIDQAMGRLFDFFADHPNVPKLMVRRLLESGENQLEIEHNIAVPAWRLFSAWTHDFSGQKLRDPDAQIFMLTVHSVLLLFLLDSQQYISLLGDSARSPELRPRIRKYIIKLVHRLLGDPSIRS
jgi:AcrR family transcriptional regulator